MTIGLNYLASVICKLSDNFMLISQPCHTTAPWLTLTFRPDKAKVITSKSKPTWESHMLSITGLVSAFSLATEPVSITQNVKTPPRLTRFLTTRYNAHETESRLPAIISMYFDNFPHGPDDRVEMLLGSSYAGEERQFFSRYPCRKNVRYLLH